MGSIIFNDIGLLVGPYNERETTLTIHGLPGAGTESHCQIVLSSLKIFDSHWLRSDYPFRVDRDPDTGKFVPCDTESTTVDPERVIVDASIASATLSPRHSTIQHVTLVQDVSSVSLSNASSVDFILYVKTSTNEAVYARASIAIHTT